jgi:hypothetical protein
VLAGGKPTGRLSSHQVTEKKSCALSHERELRSRCRLDRSRVQTLHVRPATFDCVCCSPFVQFNPYVPYLLRTRSTWQFDWSPVSQLAHPAKFGPYTRAWTALVVVLRGGCRYGEAVVSALHVCSSSIHHACRHVAVAYGLRFPATISLLDLHISESDRRDEV